MALRIRYASVVVDASGSILIASVFDLITLVRLGEGTVIRQEDKHSLSQ